MSYVPMSTEFQNDLLAFEEKQKSKPLPIRKYNENMSGLDRENQIMAHYPCDKKMLRWYKK